MWCLATVCGWTENTGKGFKSLTTLQEQPAWQWVICSLMWKLENWQTNLQEGNWISRETNGRPCGWIGFTRRKGMQGSCNPSSFSACKISPYYLFINGWKREFRGPAVYDPNGWIQYRAMMCSKRRHVTKCHRCLLTHFPPYSNKTSIIPPGPWLSCLFLSGFGRCLVSGRQRGWKQIWEKQRYPGDVRRNGKHLDGSFNKDDSIFWKYRCGFLAPSL